MKNITQQIAELEAENERLKSYEKYFDKVLKSEFGMGRKEIAILVRKHREYAAKKAQQNSGEVAAAKQG